MASRGYKKYMKKEARNANPLLNIFIISFFGMLLLFTFIIKSFSPTVDTSIGGDVQETAINTEEMENKDSIDGRLKLIQSEDLGGGFKATEELQKENKPADEPKVDITIYPKEKSEKPSLTPAQEVSQQQVTNDTVYKVYIGAYTSAEQAKVEKDIILESGSGLNPIVKCIGSNNYTLQVGIFKNKKSAESLLGVIQQSHLPGRIVQEN